MRHNLGLLLALGMAGWSRMVPLRVAVGRSPLQAAAESSQVFREDFGVGWKDRWMETVLGRRRTRYDVVQEVDEPVLRATSNQSASALWHRLALRTGVKGQVSWRWRVEASLSQNEHERERRGGDAAARLFVVFDSDRL